MRGGFSNLLVLRSTFISNIRSRGSAVCWPLYPSMFSSFFPGENCFNAFVIHSVSLSRKVHCPNTCVILLLYSLLSLAKRFKPPRKVRGEQTRGSFPSFHFPSLPNHRISNMVSIHTSLVIFCTLIVCYLDYVCCN